MDSKTRIIKHGRFYNRRVRFECDCGCVFETQDLSFRHVADMDQYSACCPECDAYLSRAQYPDQWDQEEEEQHDQA